MKDITDIYNSDAYGRLFNTVADIYECECEEDLVCVAHNIYNENRTNHYTIQDWILNLRSKEYEQGMQALRTLDDKYCCLGVLCDITPNNVWFEDGNLDLRSNYTNQSGTLLDNDILHDLGIADVTQKILAGLNDMGTSFDDIADCIEANSFASLLFHAPEFNKKGSE